MAARPKLAETNRYDDSGAPAVPDGEQSLGQAVPEARASASNAAPPRFDAQTPSARPAQGAKAYQSGDLIAAKYQLDRVLGTGGMGEVWVARNRDLDVDVAIKLLRTDASADDSEGRLLREARAAARLADPAIIRVFDFGVSELGAPYIAMELLDGEDLGRALARRGRIRPVKAVRVMLPIIRALAAAHASGIVHRDLKPENIFLTNTTSGHVQPKLMDFGIAKLDLSRALRLTHTGTMLGSPLYMSPEHARGDEVDFRADVWAICVVLYEVITGNAPFIGKNYNAVIHAITSSEPQSMLTQGVGDEALWGIVQKGMSKNPEQRWASMTELGRALAEWLLAQDVFDDVVGASLRATWIESRDASRHDPLETIHPPAAYSLDSDASQLTTPARIDTDPVAQSTTAGPLRSPAATRRVVPIVAGVVILLSAVALLVFKLGSHETPTNGGTSAAPAPGSSVAPVVSPPSLGSQDVAAPTSSASSEPTAASAEPEAPQNEPEKSVPLKNPRHRTPIRKLKNPFK